MPVYRALHYESSLTQMDPGAQTKGKWKGGVSDGKRTALVSCPDCGQVASLSQHTIATDGTVSPSLVCPYNCGFHAYVRLSGWKP